jgi:hypothetical protein
MGDGSSIGAGVERSWGFRHLGPLLVGITVLACAFTSRADAYVYWANGAVGSTTIGRANNDGTGVDNSFITGAIEPHGVAVDGKHIYWANFLGGGSIGRANLDGTGVDQNFITEATLPWGVAVDGTHIYWANAASGTTDPLLGSIGRARLDGTAPETLFGPQSNIVNAPCGVALGGGFLYWANGGSDPPTIGRSPIPDPLPDGSFVDNAGQLSACWPSVSGSHLYWSVFNLGIARAPVDDPNGGLDSVTNASATGGTAIHDSKLYWANLQEGTLSRSNFDGGSPELAFIRGANGPSGLAVDSAGSGGTGCAELALGKAKKNKRKGTAKLTAEVGCAGTLQLGGKGLKPAEKQAPAAGEAKLPIKAKGSKKKKLRKRGKAKVEAQVTFTPTSGTPTPRTRRSS